VSPEEVGGETVGATVTYVWKSGVLDTSTVQFVGEPCALTSGKLLGDGDVNLTAKALLPGLVLERMKTYRTPCVIDGGVPKEILVTVEDGLVATSDMSTA
jgi:hypothetical protein